MPQNPERKLTLDQFAIVIPARYRSSRFPGKPLIDLAGKSMIERVHGVCVEALPSGQVYVATDDERIRDHCEKKGIQVIMTPESCLTGTDRVYEAAKQISAEVLINVQGDEPLLDPNDIKIVMEISTEHPDALINAMCPIENETDFKSLTIPKVVTREDGRLLYMSRAPIPATKSGVFVSAWKQVCIYAFPMAALEAFGIQGKKGQVEAIEDIEILRFLEAGYEVHMVEVSGSSIAIDVPEDVERVMEVLDARA